MPNEPAPVRVLLDAGPAAHQSAGLSRYAERLAAHLLRFVPAGLDLALFYNAHSGHSLPPSLQGVPSVAYPFGQVPWRLGALASQIAELPFPPVQRALGGTGAPALYHATEHLLPRVNAPAVLTVHDLIFERYPEHHTRRNVAFLRAAMPRFVRAADAIIAVSEHTKRDLVEIYATPPAKITVIYEGIDPAFRPAAPEERARGRATYSPDAPYLLMVGTLEPRKNHAAALHALARLAREGFPHHLVIAGGRGWLFEPVRDLVARLGLAERVRFAGYVPDADLPALYGGAACVLLPSLYEGFGFPVLEAMACGAPVVCSNVSSLPEVAGGPDGAALLVPPENDAALADAVRLVLTQPALAAAMRQRGLGQAARFRWERCAAETLALYRSVAGI